MIEIKNKKNYSGDGWYVGRPSPLGNPFPIGPSCDRQTSVDQYEGWLLGQLDSDADNPAKKTFLAMVDEYDRKGSLVLICWCAPLLCHAEIIRKLILEMVRLLKEARVK